MMIWSIFFLSLALASAENKRYVSPEHLEALRASGQDEEYARLMGVDVSLVRPDPEKRSEASMMTTFVSPLGDILLSEEQERQGINWEKWPTWKWDNGIIPYVISESDFPEDQVQFIHNSLKDFNSKVSRVKIIPRTCESNYVHVINGNGCWSYVGRVRGAQALSLQSNGCVWNGTIHHEFEHAAGVVHEHNRGDRDSYVTVLWDNIRDEWKGSYNKHNLGDYPNIQCYDYDSVMHYPIWSPGQWWLDAFQLPEGIDRNRLGQQRGVSPGDISKLNELYA